MTRIDHFESVFRAADKPMSRYTIQTVRNVLVLTDLEHGELERWVSRIRSFLENGARLQHARWTS